MSKHTSEIRAILHGTQGDAFSDAGLRALYQHLDAIDADMWEMRRART